MVFKGLFENGHKWTWKKYALTTTYFDHSYIMLGE